MSGVLGKLGFYFPFTFPHRSRCPSCPLWTELGEGGGNLGSLVGCSLRGMVLCWGGASSYWVGRGNDAELHVLGTARGLRLLEGGGGVAGHWVGGVDQGIFADEPEAACKKEAGEAVASAGASQGCVCVEV